MFRLSQSHLRQPFCFLFVFALSCSFRFLLSLYRRLLIMLSLLKLGYNSGSGALSLETTECIVQRLVFFDFDFCHDLRIPSLHRLSVCIYTRYLYIHKVIAIFSDNSNIILYFSSYVKGYMGINALFIQTKL